MNASGLAAVVVLAAGEGTRMRSSTPKVLHMMLGRTLLGHVLAAVQPLAPKQSLVVVGHGREAVSAHLSQVAPSAIPVVQDQQLGTGHAVRTALAQSPDAEGTCLVVCADTPLLTADTLSALVAYHLSEGAAATVLTARLTDPTGYGRVIRDARGGVVAIVEQADADVEQQRVTEINSGIYAFDLAQLRPVLADLSTDNKQGEEYLTDVLSLLRERGAAVCAREAQDHQEVLGVNDRVQLAQARDLMRTRINEHWMRQGVSIIDPSSTMIGVDVRLEPDSTVHPWTLLEGKTTVAAGAEVGPGSQLRDTTVGSEAVVRFSTADRVEIGVRASVGPYTYLRPGTVLSEDTRAGAFVEAKNSVIGKGSKVPHLSYVGDAEIGEDTNIGAATVFVNYDGVNKHRTVIGDAVRIGSDTMLVAPVEVGDGAYTAAGSVITDDVPPGEMAVGRARQRNIPGWVARKRPGTVSDEAAKNASARDESANAGEDAGGGSVRPSSPRDPEGTE